MERREGGDFLPNKRPPLSEDSSSGPSVEFPARKVVRQLDFIGLSGSVSGAQQTQSRQVAERSQAPPQMQSPQLLYVSMQQPSVPPSHPSLLPLARPESPRARLRPNVNDVKDGTPKKQKHCNCKHSRCLKLYCECFASGTYCDGCNCVNCHNNAENEAARREAVEATLERNPNAFRPKIANSPQGPREIREESREGLITGRHNKGCQCKKSGCLKKYCECFQANILCSDNCKCMDCKNYEGSEERQALFHGDHANNMTYIQLAANAAITGAVGSSGFGASPLSKKRKGQDLLFASTAKDPSHVVGHLQPVGHIKVSAPSSSFSSSAGAQLGNTSTLAPSKFTYRSLLADIIQTQDLKELCSVLVVYSAEAGKMFVEESISKEKMPEARKETSASLSTQDLPQSKKHFVEDEAFIDDPSSNKTDIIKAEETCLDGANGPNERPMSPSTLALMCHEQDAMFSTTISPNGLAGNNNILSELPPDPGLTESYPEQERVVLTKFRDCLNRLITLGEIKETKYSSLAQTESGNEKDLISNNISSIRTGSRNEEFRNNHVAKVAVLPQRTSPVVTQQAASVSNEPLHRVISAAENGDVRTKTESGI